MKNVNKKLMVMAVAGVLGMGSVSAMAEDGVSANVGFTSDYAWRGVTQNNDNIAIQGGFDYASGPFSLGTWGSSLDTNGTEIDVYGAYDFGAVAVGAIYYYYPGGGSFYEANVGGDIGPVSLMVSYDPDNKTTYYEAGYSMEISKGVSLDLHVGSGDSYTTVSGGNATDYSLGVSGAYSGFDMSLAYVKSDAAADDKGKTIFAVSKSM